MSELITQLPAAMADFHFLRPWWLLSIPLACLFISWCLKRQQAMGSWASVIDPRWLPFLLEGQQQTKQRNHSGIWMLAISLIGLGLAGPTWQQLPQPVHQDQSPLIIALDLSPSMLAQDLKPSRISRARLKLVDILKSRQEGQTALLVYSGDTFLVSPLTDDTKTIISQVSVLSPQLMPERGSNTEAAIAMALRLLRDAGQSSGDILLITDGIDERATESIYDMLASSAFHLSILGVGSAEGAPIPLPEGGFAKDGAAIMVAKLKQTLLINLAHRNSGRYTDLTADDNDLRYLNSGFGTPLETNTKQIERSFDNWSDQGHWFALLLLPLLILAFRKGVVAVVLLLPFMTPQPAQAFDWPALWQTKDQQGFEKFQQQQFTEAAETFADPNWQGSAAYRDQQYDAALQAFEKDMSAKGRYNHGNTLAQLGKFDEAIKAYEQALQQEPNLSDAKANKALLEQLQQQQQNQQSEDSQQSDDQDSDSQPSENQDQPSDSQDSEQQDSDNQNPQQNSDQQGSDSDAQQNESEQENEQDSETDAQQDPAAEPQSEQEQAPQQPELTDEQREAESQQRMAEAAASTAEQDEADQAMQQFLRKVSYDPGAFLRRKFERKAQQRQMQPDNNPNQHQQRW